MTATFSPSNSFTIQDLDLNPFQQDTEATKKVPLGTIFGAIGGVLAGIALIAGIFIISKKRKGKLLPSSQGIDEVETNESAIVTHNNLRDLVQDDDPFADDFHDPIFTDGNNGAL